MYIKLTGESQTHQSVCNSPEKRSNQPNHLYDYNIVHRFQLVIALLDGVIYSALVSIVRRVILKM